MGTVRQPDWIGIFDQYGDLFEAVPPYVKFNIDPADNCYEVNLYILEGDEVIVKRADLQESLDEYNAPEANNRLREALG